MFRFFCALLLLATPLSAKTLYKVGLDPTFYPLNFEEQTPPLNAFIHALVDEINKNQKGAIQIIPSDYATLLSGLELNLYDAILATIPENAETQDTYTFSDPLLLIGPLLIVKKTSTATSLTDLKGKIIGTTPLDDSTLLAQKYPVLIRSFDHLPHAFQALVHGEIDALLAPTIQAKTLMANGFSKALKIVSPPLTTQAIRLITLKDKNAPLLTLFNHGLKKARKTGHYARLLHTFLRI